MSIGSEMRYGRPIKAFVAGLAAVVLGAGALTACGDDGGGGSGGSGDLKLGLSVPYLSTPFFVVMQSFVEADAKKAGVSMQQPTNADQDAGQQVTDFRTLIDGGANGVLAGLVDAGAIAPALDYAEKQDVPVVVVDDKPSKGKVYMTVRSNNAGMGAQACKTIGAKLKGKGKVLSLQGDQATTNGRDRTTGFNNCMKKDFPDIEVIERPTDWETPKAAAAAQTALTANKDIAAIYLQSDSVMLTAVQQVLKKQGRDAKVGQPGHVFLVSIDGTSTAHEAIRNDTLDASVSQGLDLYAKYGVKYLQDAKKGVKQKVGPTDHNSEIVKDENGNLMDLLPSPLVTKKNVDDKALWGNAPGAKG